MINLSNDTLTKLKNFANIYTGMTFKAGSIIQTMSSGNTIFAETTIAETFPRDFPIYSLNEFLKTLSLFDCPTIEFDNKFMTISDANQKSRYYYCGEGILKELPKKRVELPSVDIEFTLTKENFDKILKSADVMGLPSLGISKKGIRAFDPKNSTSNDFSIALDFIKIHDGEVKLRREDMKLISSDYLVKISERGLSSFYSQELNLQYFVALEN